MGSYFNDVHPDMLHKIMYFQIDVILSAFDIYIKHAAKSTKETIEQKEIHSIYCLQVLTQAQTSFR